MIQKVLVANRGEIAVRIIRACRELGIPTVAVHSEADDDALHVHLADEDVCIGPGPSTESYLNIPRIISAAEITNCDAIHPGYGFLSESAKFAEICESCDLTFIGPTPETIRAVGDKASARRSMQAAGIPLLPGSEGPLSGVEEALELARVIGFPVLLKATAGGGGRGMRRVMTEEDMESCFAQASSEALAAFGNGALYLEKLALRPRHVEVQVLGDTQGNLVHLFERECSIQRRHQKLIEESPSPALNEEMRQRLCDAGANAARAFNYRGAGTVEFLLDERGQFSFMEMNARIQVEHPVTEMLTGRDLVKEQILIASGHPLSFRQKDLVARGHVMECRVNAEDPARGFAPSPGKIGNLHLPGGPGIRVDTHLFAGAVIPPYYDSLVAKVLAQGEDREEALVRMKRALEEFSVEGIHTTIPLLLEILDDSDFVSGKFDTGFLETRAQRAAGEEEAVEAREAREAGRLASA